MAKSIYSRLYDYQKAAVKATSKIDKGIVCLPTGMGKTMIQSAMIAKEITEFSGFRIFVVNAPRIMLSFQLFKNISEELITKKIDARYINLHSGKQRKEDEADINQLRTEYGIEHSDILSTTSIAAINEELNKSRRCNQPVVIFSTYHSAHKLVNISYEIEMILNDEAHYLVQERFNENINNIGANRNYYFTATMRHTDSDEGIGMNNSSIYGEVLYQKTPREAIDMGKMVRPRLHIVSHHDGHTFTDNDVDAQIGRVITDCYDQHQYQLRSKVNAKMLVAAEGTDDIYNFLNSQEYRDLVESGIRIYALASDDRVGNRINEERVNRQEFLKRLQIDGQNKAIRLIVIHYDILSEGIDVPGLTGALILRNMSKAKFVQTMGRILRLNVQDRIKIDAGELQPTQIKKMVKPYGYVILPMLEREDTDITVRFTNMISELREYDFEPIDDMIVSVNGSAIPVKEGPEAFELLKGMRTRVTEAIEELVSEIEDDKIASLSFAEFIAA
jgi:superfamily II DNA or RNA helicase